MITGLICPCYRYEIFSEKVGHQLQNDSVDECIQSAIASTSFTTNQSPAADVSTDPAVNTQQAPAGDTDTSNNNSDTNKQALSASKHIPAGHMSSTIGNGAVMTHNAPMTRGDDASTSRNASSDLDTDLKKSKSPQRVVKVGQYRMSNIQSLDEGNDSSLFNSAD